MNLRPLSSLVAAIAVAFLFHTGVVLADGDKPQFPKPEPKPKTSGEQSGSVFERDEQIYSLGYWQAKGGAYTEALQTLQTASNQSDPRIMTMMGFALRKLGRMDEAMGYYAKVLAADPARTTTRQYLGEAFLQLRQPAKAKEQLAEIARYCGQACEDYQLLSEAIAHFEKSAG
jgi:predicted Zn-dependent protease